MGNVRSMLLAVAGAVLASVVFVGVSTTTTSARFSASTENTGNVWETAKLSLDVADRSGDAVELFLDAANLYPGLIVRNCVEVTINTSLPTVAARLHGQVVQSSPLAELFDVVVEVLDSSANCSDDEPGERLFLGTLAELIDRHGSFAEGLVVSSEPVEALTLRFTGSVRDTNAAQGLELAYLVVMEARP